MISPQTKEQQVEAMFDGIAHRYDFLNHVLSLGIDKLWRKRLIKRVLKNSPEKVVDVATGTADLAINLAKKKDNIIISGVDISERMLERGKIKIERLGLISRIDLTKASSENLPFTDNAFDASMVAFGVRNFENPLKGLQEIFRVVKPSGTIHVLEFTTPRLAMVRWLYGVYFNRILPWVGRKISGHLSAYTYLPNSVEKFKERAEFVELLQMAGFVNAEYSEQSMGIATIYWAYKPN